MPNKIIIGDVRLEAEVLPRGSLEAAKVLPRPRLDVLMPRLGLASASWLCLGLASISMLWPRPHLGLVSSALSRLEASEPPSYVTIS